MFQVRYALNLNDRSHVILLKARLMCRVIKSLSLNLSTLLTTMSEDPEKAGSALFTCTLQCKLPQLSHFIK